MDGNGDTIRHREVAAMYANDETELTCFNCEEVGHLIRHCPYPRNPRIRCYRCGHLDVITRDCPNCSPRQGEGPNYGVSRPGGGQSRSERHRDDQRNYPNDNRAESGRNSANGGRSDEIGTTATIIGQRVGINLTVIGQVPLTEQTLLMVLDRSRTRPPDQSRETQVTRINGENDRVSNRASPTWRWSLRK